MILTNAIPFIRIQAADLGTPMMSSTAHLVVLVLDVNDNPPIFERTQYSETISELARVGTSVLRVLGRFISMLGLSAI